MIFGLRNAAQIFQRIIDEVVRGLDFCYVYLNDIIVASYTIEKYHEHLRKLFQSLQQFCMTVNITKYVFRASEVSVIRHLISGKELDTESGGHHKFP